MENQPLPGTWYRYWADGAALAQPPAAEQGTEGSEVFHVKPSNEEPQSPQGPNDGVAAETVDIEAPGATPDAPPTPQESDTAKEAALQTSFENGTIVTIVNQKGGVGKTTTAVSLSAALAQLGSRVLLVDLDPQGNATSGLGLRVHPGQPTVYNVLVEGLDIMDAIEPTSVRNLFVVPSNIDLAGAEIELVSTFSREQRLRKALHSIRSEYDVILVDCPPTLGLLTVNALTAGDGVIVPIQGEYYALEGLGALRRNADLIREQLNPNLEVVGYLLTMMDSRTRLSQQVADEVTAHFGGLVFNTRIPRSVRLAEAPGFGQPITVFDPSSRAANAYKSLAREVLQRLAAGLGPAAQAVVAPPNVDVSVPESAAQAAQEGVVQ